MAPRDRREEAFRAGLANPLMGDIGPLQRLYGTVQAIGSELGGGDMGTPFGQRFGESQKATKAEVKRLQELRKAHPEEFGRGMMFAQEQQDPYMLGLGVGSMGAMRPMGTTRFEPAYGESPVQQIAGRGPMDRLPAPAPRMLGGPQGMAEAAPVAPYYRNVPPEMGTSMRPMTPFQQNQVGLSTGRFGAQGYAPEMAVTDFESYAPGGMGRTTTGPTPMNKFDQNMMDAYRRGRMSTGASRGMYGEYTPEEMGSAIVPYRQGGLVYEPVGGPQGAAPRQIGGPQGAPRLGYERGPIEGQWSEVYGIGGPQGRPGYGGGMDFGVTREGMAASPTGMRFDPRMAAAAIGGGLGFMAGRGGERGQPQRYELPQMDIYGRVAPTGLSGQAPSAGSVFEQPPIREIPVAPMGTTERAAGGAAKGPTDKKAGGKGAPMPPTRPEDLRAEAPFDPNLNYLVTQALDRLLGGGEAERGRRFQQYYESQGYY